ncbi:MAG: hypothetical protein ACREJM_08445 [Candidatus Saccharimonadales bacterium]
MTGDFFAIGKEQWNSACKLGLNPAVAFLVLARGSGRDNITTRWSAEAVAQHTGISWRRAQDAIAELERAKLASNTKEAGQRPTRKLAFPDDMDKALWLPNALVDGVGGAASPVARLRMTQNVDYLQAFIELYGLQDLAGDGGLPRKLIWTPFTREHVCDAGQFKVYGFTHRTESYCNTTGSLARFHDKVKPKDGWRSWAFLGTLQNMGLLETVHYLAEGESTDAELLHALTGDADALAVSVAASNSISSLPEWVTHRGENYDYALPVIRDIPAPAVCGVYRLTFRPHTKLTAAWWAQHKAACERFTSIYDAIGSGDYQRAIAA